MEVFSVRGRATVEVSINEFGTEVDKTIYYEWAQDNPQVRKILDDPTDDGKGPMPMILKETILSCLRRRYDHLRAQSRSPWISMAEMAEISIRMSDLYSLARWLHPGRLEWPPSF